MALHTAQRQSQYLSDKLAHGAQLYLLKLDGRAVGVVSVTGSLIHLSCEASVASRPEKLCLSCTATYFYKPRTA